MDEMRFYAHSLEREMLREAGLVDAAVEAGLEPPSYTYHSADLYQRIDYIWVSPDLEIDDAWRPRTNASDHLPVIAIIDR